MSKNLILKQSIDNLNDELIDPEFIIDTKTLIISESSFNEIKNNNYCVDIIQKNLMDAFRYLRTKKSSEFRKLVTSNKNIINQKYDKTFLIHEACKIGNSDYVSLLLLLGSKCNLIDDHGFMAQHYAVNSKNILIVDILYTFGHSFNLKDKNGNTPFHHAVINNDIDMAKTLITYKTDPTILNNHNKTILDICQNKSDIYHLIKKYYDSY
jgi:ankyrin repeat protein